MRTIQTLGHAEAQRAIDAVRQAAEGKGHAPTVAVADAWGELIGLLRMDGAPVSTVTIASNKAWTAARERKPSAAVGEQARNPEEPHQMDYYGDGRHTGWGGGLPVEIDGVVVGAVAVSGLKTAEDIELARLGVEAITREESDL
jgi:glc operon protein GlcG